MAKIKQLKVRMSPFDMDVETYRKADELRQRRDMTWRAFLSEGVELVLADSSAQAVVVNSNNGGTEEV
jgi:hypothetical protein